MKIKKSSYKLRLDVGIDFSCAILLTYGDQSEKMHGHNFQVAVELEGSLTNDYFLVDYRHIKNILRSLCKELDEHTLIPTTNPSLHVKELDSGYLIEVKGKKYSLPKEDSILIDLPNLSTELLAFYFAQKFKEHLIDIGYENIHALSVEIKEKPGQSAIYQEQFDMG